MGSRVVRQSVDVEMGYEGEGGGLVEVREGEWDAGFGVPVGDGCCWCVGDGPGEAWWTCEEMFHEGV